MAIDIKEIGTEKAERTAQKSIETGVMGADLVTGAAVTVAENVARAVSHPRREAHKIERRGAAANKAFGREVENLVEDAAEAVDAIMPERVALRGLQTIKARARRQDPFGDLAYRTLEVLNGGFTVAVKTLTRFERATTPPARPAPSRPVSRAVSRTRRTARRTVAASRSTARRATSRARRTERKSA